jgi:hypothetical protein
MKYGQLFSISLKHEYYESESCPDFTVSPQQYSEAMREKDMEALIGQYAEVPEGKLAEILMRRDTSTVLKNHRCVVKPKSNGINVYVPTDDGKTPAYPFADSTRLSFYLHLKNSEFPLYTDFTRLPAGNGFTVTYADQEKLPNEVFASVSIQRDFNVMDEKNPLDFEIRFPSKSLRWVYYLVTDPGNATSDFSITNGGTEFPTLAWEQLAPNSTDTIDKMLTEQYPLLRRVRFVSKQAIPYRESGLPNIHLAFGQYQIFDNLLSPSLRNFYRTNVDTTSGLTDAIYAIVKCVTNTTLTKV